MRNSRVYIDTMVMVEAHRVKAWKALAKGYRLLTVEKCLEEAATGDRSSRQYIEVDAEGTREDFAEVKLPSKRDRAELGLQFSGNLALDPGEFDLLACAWKDPEVWFLCGPDRAAFRALHLLGFTQRMVSLEALFSGVGVRDKTLKGNYTERWLSDCRLQFLLEDGP